MVLTLALLNPHLDAMTGLARHSEKLLVGIDPVSKSQRMKLKVVREFQLTGTLSGNILLVML